MAKLIDSAKRNAQLAVLNHHRQAPIDWAILHFFLGSGLRTFELTALLVGDLHIEEGESAAIVRRGKGGKSRIVALSSSLREHLIEFLTWKNSQGEPVDRFSPLFLSERNRLSSPRAIRHMFQRLLRRAGLRPYPVHGLRHYHLSQLYAVTRVLVMVADQAGHSSVSTTQSYVRVSLSARQAAASNLI